MDWALDEGVFREWILGGGSAPAGPVWEKAEALRARGRLRFWVAAGSVAPLQEWMSGLSGSGVTPAVRSRRDRAWESVRVFTVDAQSVAEALAGGSRDLGARIAIANFHRIAPQGVFVSRSASLVSPLGGKPAEGKPPARTPEAALEAFDREADPIAPIVPIGKGPGPRIPMLDLQAEYRELHPEIDRALLQGAAEAQYVLGPFVTRFEQALGAYLGTKHAIGVSSGTESLVLALRALALTRFGKERFDASDRILTTPFTFVATGDAILRSGATPVFVDIDPATMNMDVAALRRYLDATQAGGPQGGRTVGIIPVHLFGQSCPMDDILSLARERGLFVLEDVAQAFGADWRGRKLGTLGDLGSFSFFPSKNLGGFGDAGAVTTDDGDLAMAVRQLLKHGSREKNRFDILGYNARLDSLQAGVLLAKLPRVDANNRLRMDIAGRYLEGLRGIPDLILPRASGAAGSLSVFHQFTLRTSRRADLQAHLEACGISTMLYYPYPLHRMPLFQGRQVVAAAGDAGTGLPQAELAADQVLSLPMGPSMEAPRVDAVIAAVRGFFGA